MLKFKRCLEILQIHNVTGLTNFMRAADKANEEDLEEFLAMKFNMTKSDCRLFISKVLCLSAG